MNTFFRRSALIVLALAACNFADGQVRSRIVREINDGQLQVLRGNTHRLARAEFDQGVAPVDLPMDRMLLVLSRSAQQETALDNLLTAQQDPSSPQYHQWLTPEQFGQQFGAADQDIQTVTAWLESQGFHVNRVSNGRTVIDFSGTASQVEQAFHTEMHKYVVKGQAHWANASDPQIPAALAPVVMGVATLHNFYKKPQLIATNQKFEASYQTGAQPQFTSSNGLHALSPGDYATIYNIKNLYFYGIHGDGVTVAVVGRTNINVSDVNSFRSYFGLSNNPPQIVVNGADPGNLGGGEEAEAVLDTSWAGAVATGAVVKLVVSQSTNTADGVDLSELYIIDNNLSDVMTESFGGCEANYTQAEGNFYSSIAQQAAAEGITYVVAAGDSGAEGCDEPTETTATGPLSVNILSSTPYTTAVGGTEFNERGLYEWQSGNNTDLSSALGYIFENVWNESCADQCGNLNPGLWAGGGGASTLFAKPSWQTGVPGIPNDGARDVPDVSLTAAGHDAYLLCLDGSCTPNSTGRIYFQGYGGTSAATPSFAGIMALVVQKRESRQGLANPMLYSLAAQETMGSCNASPSTVVAPAGNCIFNDITVGNNAVPGESGYGTTSAAYQAGVGYDLATGLGSVNVTNLVNGWYGAPGFSSHFHMFIDQPGPQNSTFIGSTQFSGWALSDNSTITDVQLAVDGAPYEAATYGVSRGDVCAVYPARSGCPNVGWSAQIDTTQLPDGVHALDVTATSAAGNHATISSSFTVANWTSADPMRVYIDNPGPSSLAFTGDVVFNGWAINDTGAIRNVSISVDGISYSNATYGLKRPDVCVAYPGRIGCPNVGWSFTLSTAYLMDGVHTLAVTGLSETGRNTTVMTSFTTSNPHQVTLWADYPGAQNETFSGTVAFSGWAISGRTIYGEGPEVSVSIDGYAQYFVAKVSRPDVCAAYPGQDSCPYVGWSVVLDTTLLANGPHVLKVTATPFPYGVPAKESISFNVANATATNRMKVNIDSPSPQNSVVTGLTSLTGWALDDGDAVTSVEVAIDGILQGNATYGFSEPGACVAYPGRAGCPNVGWTYSLDTTLIPNGSHELEVTGIDLRTGNRFTAVSTFTVANWTGGNPMKMFIDTPNSQSGTLSGSATVAGWAIDDIASITNVAISVDGLSLGNANYGISRGDVCAVYPDRAGCPDVGWSFNLDTTLLADGTHTLAVTGTSSGGQRSTTSTTFSVANEATNPILTFIDQPASNASLTGTVALAGWAIDRTGNVPITTVQVLVDGAYQGDASYGVSRGDVCLVYPGEAGCPNVGWNFSLDTTLFANGTHSLEIRSVAAGGQEKTMSIPVGVLNTE